MTPLDKIDLTKEAERLRKLFTENMAQAQSELTNHPNMSELVGELLNKTAHYAEAMDRYVIASTSDLQGNITSASQAFCAISGYTKAELIGHNHNLLRHPDMPDSIYKNLWKTIQSGKSWHGEVKNRRKNGTHYWVDVHIDTLFDSDHNIIGYAAIRQDITEKKLIEQMTVTDELTGCFNRRHFNRLFPEEIRRAKRDQHPLAFFMVDADNFKKYNDTYGHQAGDEVLKSLAKVLHSVFSRAGDYVFRLGGEEFAIIAHIKRNEDAGILAQRVNDMIYDENIDHSGNLPYHRVTLSLGVMILDPNVEYVYEEIYKYADEALYRAKSKGRHRYELVGNDDDDIELF